MKLLTTHPYAYEGYLGIFTYITSNHIKLYCDFMRIDTHGQSIHLNGDGSSLPYCSEQVNYRLNPDGTNRKL